MVRVQPADVATVTAVAAVMGVIALVDGAGVEDWLFGTVMLAASCFLVRQCLRAWWRAREEGERAERLRRVEPGEVARQAVLEERRRLNDEISLSLRQLLGEVQDEVRLLKEVGGAASVDPGPGLRRIHAHTRRATSELRRQLGLLRGEEAEGLAHHGTESSEELSRRPLSRWPSRDQMLGAGLASLAVVEALVYLPMERADWSPWAVLLAGTAGATATGWRAAPAPAASVCAAVYALATVGSVAVPGGFWFVAVVGGLLWSLVVSADRSRHGAAVLALAVAVLANTWVTDRENVFFSAYVVAVGVASGLIVRFSRRERVVAEGRAAELERRLAGAAAEAVRTERVEYARDLHDTVSHAVGLIALQAGAAEVSWPDDPVVVRRAVALIDATARQARAELDRWCPDDRQPSSSVEQLRDLVERMRAAGTRVTLTVDVAPPEALRALVYRVVQEGLTNAVRHDPGASVSVRVRLDQGAVVVEVRDESPADGSALPPAAVSGGAPGYGLVGLRERVGLAGGTFSCGRGVVGPGFGLAATLPVSPSAVR